MSRTRPSFPKLGGVRTAFAPSAGAARVPDNGRAPARSSRAAREWYGRRVPQGPSTEWAPLCSPLRGFFSVNANLNGTIIAPKRGLSSAAGASARFQIELLGGLLGPAEGDGGRGGILGFQLLQGIGDGVEEGGIHLLVDGFCHKTGLLSYFKC